MIHRSQLCRDGITVAVPPRCCWNRSERGWTKSLDHSESRIKSWEASESSELLLFLARHALPLGNPMTSRRQRSLAVIPAGRKWQASTWGTININININTKTIRTMKNNCQRSVSISTAYLLLLGSRSFRVIQQVCGHTPNLRRASPQPHRRVRSTPFARHSKEQYAAKDSTCENLGADRSQYGFCFTSYNSCPRPSVQALRDPTKPRP